MRRRILASLGAHMPTARDYVQDGLILQFDGIENAGYGITDVNSTTWKNLVDDYDLTLKNGASFDGSALVLNGDGNSYAENNGYHPSRWVTCELVILPHVGTSTYAFFQSYYAEYIDGVDMSKYNVGFTSTSGGYVATFSHTIEAGNTKISLNHGELAYCAWTKNGTSPGETYKNGVGVENGVYNDYWGSSYNSGMCVGMKRTPRKFYGEFFAIRWYSRKLSSTEIAANYAVDKARFNLT